MIVTAEGPLRRAQILPFFAKLPPCLIGMEACGTSHHWARELTGPGHTVKLMPPEMRFEDARGFSGSLVFNTRYIETVAAGGEWSPAWSSGGTQKRGRCSCDGSSMFGHGWRMCADEDCTPHLPAQAQLGSTTAAAQYAV
jgi:hypothetical protein